MASEIVIAMMLIVIVGMLIAEIVKAVVSWMERVLKK